MLKAVILMTGTPSTDLFSKFRKTKQNINNGRVRAEKLGGEEALEEAVGMTNNL